MEIELLEKAQDELKRADHLMFVSLKYTRTVDVIKSIVSRLKNTIDACFEVLLVHATEKGKIEQVPKLPKMRMETVRTLYPEFSDFIDFYMLLRKIDKAEFERDLEYRRHVCMTALVEKHRMHITIDIVQDYYEKAKEFIHLVSRAVV